jgi:excisionase family DNA binding protein
LTNSFFGRKNNDMGLITTAQAAERLGISVRRVQELIGSQRLPAQQFGRTYVVNEEDLKLVENRKVGRPPKAQTEKASTPASKKKGKKK